jgi:hypothetical protein
MRTWSTDVRDFAPLHVRVDGGDAPHGVHTRGHGFGANECLGLKPDYDEKE